MGGDVTMRVVYVAGPFRAESLWGQEQNVRRAEELALEVWRMGAACICPHNNTRFYQGAASDEVWLKGDLELVLRSDAVLMVPGWEKSVGATGEYKYAEQHHIPVFTSLAALRAWLEVQGD